MRLAMVMLALATTAACSREPEVDLKNASVGDVANELAESGGPGQFLRPGTWQTRIEVEDVVLPGLPPAQQAEMKRMFGQQNVIVDQCLTPEEARRPAGKFFTGKESKDCRYDRFKMGAGKIDAVMRCQGEPSGEMTLNIAGSYTPETSTTRNEMKISSGNQGGMTITALVEARRLGECDGKAK